LSARAQAGHKDDEPMKTRWHDAFLVSESMTRRQTARVRALTHQAVRARESTRKTSRRRTISGTVVVTWLQQALNASSARLIRNGPED
jgi:hypothetical protein